MTIETVPLSSLVPSKGNPRKKINDIEGLAASIKTDGLLQNLVVKPEGGKSKRYAIISGERRYRALMLLEERGELPEDFGVPVEVRGNLSDDDGLRIATVENLQRANLAPLEEAAALAKLIHKGATLDDVSAQTGLSSTTIKRRLVLNGLCKEAKKALRGGGINLAQAEALTLTGHEAQRNVISGIEKGYSDFRAKELRETFLDDRPTVSMAIFPLEQYEGTITTDLFAEGETSYFDDFEQFFELQKKAVESLAEKYRETAAWVEVTESYSIPEWQYRKAKKRKPSGVLINLSPSGRVEVRENLAKREIDEETAKEITDHPLARSKKASYAAPLRRYIAHHKSMAVQEMLLNDPRKAKEIAAVKALIDLDLHSSIMALAQEDEPQSPYKALEAQALLYAKKLGLSIAEDDLVWNQLPRPKSEDVTLYEAVKTFTDHELDELHTLLAALSFGQHDCESLDTGDTLFNRVAKDLAIDMKSHWKPDRSFIGRRSREQLITIAKECGYADGRSMIQAYKKSELVAGLLKHFADAFVASTPDTAQAKALAWLPEVMLFPTIDPDATEEVHEAA